MLDTELSEESLEQLVKKYKEHVKKNKKKIFLKIHMNSYGGYISSI